MELQNLCGYMIYCEFYRSHPFISRAACVVDFWCRWEKPKLWFRLEPLKLLSDSRTRMIARETETYLTDAIYNIRATRCRAEEACYSFFLPEVRYLPDVLSSQYDTRGIV